MSLRLITPPAPIVSWAELDAHLRLSGDTDDQAYVESLAAAATSYLDGYKGVLGRALGLQTWELVLDRFPCGAIEIPLGPLSSVTSVKHDDEDGNEQTVDSADYVVDNASLTGWVVPVSDFSWPATLDGVNAVRVRFVAGSATIDPADAAIVKLLVGIWYQNREAVNVGNIVTEIPLAASALITARRRMNI
jgi:uncharacterized phiE125 gp8 family phage protein